MNVYLIAGGAGGKSLCLFTVVAENKWKAFEMYRETKVGDVFHFSQIERERMSIAESNVIPLGTALEFVPEGVITMMEEFLDKLPEMFLALEEPPPPLEKTHEETE